MKVSPQNPYASCLVSASAGSGKTYQLSQRFLNLVGAGADPTKILTVTFTNKAAAEMKERILSDAGKLLESASAASEFETSLRAFYQAHNKSSEYALAPPLSGKDTATSIIDAASRLKITTIDSIFYTWVSKFTGESDVFSESSQLSATPTLMDIPQKNQLVSTALSETIISMAVDETWGPLIKSFANRHGLFKLITITESLSNYGTLLWAVRKKMSGSLPIHLLPESSEFQDEASLLSSLKAEFAELIPCLSPKMKPQVEEAVANLSLEALLDCKFITKTDGQISKTYVKGKNREAYAAQVERIDSGIRSFLNDKKIKSLNNDGALAMAMHAMAEDTLKRLQTKLGLIKFDDLVKGSYEVLLNPDNAGVQFLINSGIDHLMLDEFQDTSEVQWDIFRSIAIELRSKIADDGIVPPSIFIVGDTKQSIYGFREADPKVMEFAAESLSPFGIITMEMDQSFRTAQIVLDFVDQVFAPLKLLVPPHTTACLKADKPFIDNFGAVTVLDAPLAQDCPDTSPIEEEAAQIARFITALLADETSLIPDKVSGELRRIRASDCVVLFRNTTNAHAFESALREEHIPSYHENSKGFFEQTLVADCMALLKFLALPADSLALARVLKSPFFGFSDAELSPILFEHAKLEDGASPPSLPDLLERLLSVDGRVLASEVISSALETSGYLDAVRKSYGPMDQALMLASSDRMKELLVATEALGHRSFFTVFHALDQMKADADISQVGASPDAVRLMTIHKSKGLEFGVVVLADAFCDWSKRDRYWVKVRSESGLEGLSYLGTASEQPKGDPITDQRWNSLDEEIEAETERLLYVALTRARHYLVISGQQPTASKKPSKLWEAMTTAAASDQFVPVSGNGFSGVQRRILALAPDSSPIISSEAPIAPEPKATASLASPAEQIPELPELLTVAPHSLGKSSQPKHDEPAASVHHDVASILNRAPKIAQSWMPRVAGIFVHAVVEDILTGVEGRDHQDRCNKVLATELSPSELIKLKSSPADCQLIAEIFASLGSLVGGLNLWSELLSSEARLYCEQSFAYQKDDSLISGAIDLIALYPDQTAICYDFKLSDKASEGLVSSYRNQVGLYSEAMQVAMPSYRWSGALIALPRGEVIPC